MRASNTSSETFGMISVTLGLEVELMVALMMCLFFFAPASVTAESYVSLSK